MWMALSRTFSFLVCSVSLAALIAFSREERWTTDWSNFSLYFIETEGFTERLLLTRRRGKRAGGAALPSTHLANMQSLVDLTHRLLLLNKAPRLHLKPKSVKLSEAQARHSTSKGHTLDPCTAL